MSNINDSENTPLEETLEETSEESITEKAAEQPPEAQSVRSGEDAGSGSGADTDGPSELEKLQSELDEAKDRYMRLAAEFDNYKKRTAKEKEALSVEIKAAVINQILPVLDNLERAAATDGSGEDVRAGLELVLRQMNESMSKLGVSEIEAQDLPFDPQVHNAVMHVESEDAGENTVVDVLQKGYRIGERIIRHSMVKVAN